MMAVMAETGSQ